MLGEMGRGVASLTIDRHILVDPAGSRSPSEVCGEALSLSELDLAGLLTELPYLDRIVLEGRHMLRGAFCDAHVFIEGTAHTQSAPNDAWDVARLASYYHEPNLHQHKSTAWKCYHSADGPEVWKSSGTEAFRKVYGIAFVGRQRRSR